MSASITAHPTATGDCASCDPRTAGCGTSSASAAAWDRWPPRRRWRRLGERCSCSNLTDSSEGSRIRFGASSHRWGSGLHYTGWPTTYDCDFPDLWETLTEGQAPWTRLPEETDQYMRPDGEFIKRAPRERYRDDLHAAFPRDRAVIDRYLGDMQRINRDYIRFMTLAGAASSCRAAWAGLDVGSEVSGDGPAPRCSLHGFHRCFRSPAGASLVYLGKLRRRASRDIHRGVRSADRVHARWVVDPHRRVAVGRRSVCGRDPPGGRRTVDPGRSDRPGHGTGTRRRGASRRRGCPRPNGDQRHRCSRDLLSADPTRASAGACKTNLDAAVELFDFHRLPRARSQVPRTLEGSMG